MTIAYLCDFDGTIAARDIGAEFVGTFSPDGEGERRELLAAWRRGTIGSRELTEAECAFVRVDEARALAFIDRFEIDPHFVGFVGEAEGRGDRVQVVSDGFDFYIRHHLERAGLAHLPRTANRLRFEHGRVVPEFPNAGAGCGRCGNCKGEHVRRAQAEGFRVVMVGDGFSDRCAARLADHVLARGALAEWCEAENIASESFADFAAVSRWAEHHQGVAMDSNPPRPMRAPEWERP